MQLKKLQATGLWVPLGKAWGDPGGGADSKLRRTSAGLERTRRTYPNLEARVASPGSRGLTFWGAPAKVAATDRIQPFQPNVWSRFAGFSHKSRHWLFCQVDWSVW